VNLYICRLDLELRQLFLLLLSIATVIVWFLFRKENWSWILQVRGSNLPYICRLDLELRQLFLLLLSIATVIIWFLFRKKNWSWILQVRG